MKRIIRDNLKRIRDRIDDACNATGRESDAVRIVAVTKYASTEAVRALLELGHVDLGESKVQDLTHRAAMIQEARSRQLQADAGNLAGPRWHMVGHLQRNKVKALLPWVSLVHSVDSLRLAEELSDQAEKLDVDASVLLQINAAGEGQKFGVAVGAVPHLAEQIVSLPRLRLLGLMSMAPLTENSKLVDWTFGRTREIFEDLAKERFIGPEFCELSMGMSGDFESAVRHGATMVRIGSALFEGVSAEV